MWNEYTPLDLFNRKYQRILVWYIYKWESSSIVLYTSRTV